MKKKKWIWWHAQKAHIKIADNNSVSVKNVINGTGFSQYEFNIQDIEAVYILYEYFKLSFINTVHTGWAFKVRDKILIFSPEARKPDTGVYKPVSLTKGAIGSYKFIYLIFTTKSFKELKGDYSLMPVRINKQKMINLFANIAQEVNRINSKDKRYNIFFRNCASQMIKEVCITQGMRPPVFRKKFIQPVNIHEYLQTRIYNI